MIATRRTVLVIDSDTKFLNSIKGDPQFPVLSPVLSGNGDEASRLIKDKSTTYAGVFVSATISWPTALPLVKEVHRHHPATPVFVLFKDFEPFSRNEISRLAIQDMIPKPITLSDLVKKVLPNLSVPDLPFRDPAKIKTFPALKDEADYMAIPIEEFVAEVPFHFDTYLKLEGKYLKIFNAMDIVSVDRIKKYFESGVTHLYIGRDSIMRCLSYCDVLQSNLLANPEASLEMKFLKTVGLGKEFMDAFHTIPAKDFNVDYGLSFLSGLFNLVRTEKRGRNEVASEYLKNVDHIEHAVGVSFICALLAEPLKLDAPKLLKQLGLAALFHDIGLKDMPPHFAFEDMSRLTDSEKVLYMSHVEKSTDVMRTMRGVDEVAIQAVAQHHERRDNSGFPKKVKTGEIHLFAELIGIADELSLLIHRHKQEPDLVIEDVLEQRVFNGFSNKTIEAFRSVFMNSGLLETLKRVKT